MRSFSFTAVLTAALATTAFAGGSVTDVRINEVDADQVGTDALEFIELHGPGNQALDDLFIVLYNGSSDLEYEVVDLDGQTVPADGFFVMGVAAVTNVDYTPSGLPATNAIQNGADAVALWHDTTGLLVDSDFFGTDPSTAPAGATLIDAIVYDTNDADDVALLAALGITGPQVNEDDGTDSTTDSNQRCPDGGTAFDTASYIPAPPTPGAPNTCAVSAWTDLGSALGGVSGDPLLVGSGDLTDGSSNSADLTNAAGSAMSGLFIGIDPNTPMPFKGGTLVPVPVFQVVFATTSVSGEIPTNFTWPNAGMSGFNVYAQWAITDAAAPAGVALSNAIQGTTP